MKIHMIAICGTGMGSFAGLLKESGHDVRGSDKNIYPPMSEKLKEWNIPIFEGFSPKNLDWNPELVIIGNVITKKNEEAKEVFARNLRFTSFPEALGTMYLQERHSIVVTGTHGKTTTSALCAWLLFEAKKDPGFLIGGIVKNFPESFRNTGVKKPFVIEGDEYDTAFFDKQAKFFHYHAKTAIVTSLEFDHADIYNDIEEIANSFRKFVARMPSTGTLLIAKHAPGAPYLEELAQKAPCRVLRYAVEKEADFSASIVDMNENGTEFLLTQKRNSLGRFFLPLSGRYNIANATAALAVAIEQGVSPEKAKEALSRFSGVRRRQEEFGKIDNILLIDDFAHHPTAVSETLQALREKYPTRRIWAIFEPRSATCRRNILEPQYELAFDAANEVLIAKAHRAEEFPIEERFDSARLARNISVRAKVSRARYLPDANTIVTCLDKEAKPNDLIVVMSNGGFDNIQTKLLHTLKKRNKQNE